MTGTAADKARETARKDTGKFGNQPHADSGMVQAGPASEQALVEVPIDWDPQFAPRHPHTGDHDWYVRGVVYLNGTVGCVDNQKRDKKWRITNHRSPLAEQPTFTTPEDAAVAEYLYSRTPTAIREDLAQLKKMRADTLRNGVAPNRTNLDWKDGKIAEGEKLLTDAGLPLEV